MRHLPSSKFCPNKILHLILCVSEKCLSPLSMGITSLCFEIDHRVSLQHEKLILQGVLSHTQCVINRLHVFHGNLCEDFFSDTSCETFFGKPTATQRWFYPKSVERDSEINQFHFPFGRMLICFYQVWIEHKKHKNMLWV